MISIPTQRASRLSGLLVWVLIVGVGFATAAILVIEPAAFFLPMAGTGAVFALWRLPLKYSSAGILLGLLTADYLPEVPFEHLWQSPLQPLGNFLFINLSTTTGIGPLRLPGIDLLIIGLLGVGVYRRATHSTIDPPKTPSVRNVSYLLLVMIFTILALWMWGVARGGDANESLWQFRWMLTLPIATFLFLGSFQGTHQELRMIYKVMVASAVWKSLLGIYFVWFILRPMGKITEYTTSHSDTVLYACVLSTQVALLYHRFDRTQVFNALLWVPVVIYGMVLNDRRLAYVTLGGCIFCIVAMMPLTRGKRQTLRVLITMAPLLVAYTVVGWNAQSAIFGPAQLIKSIVVGDPSQAGADYRDMENFNVLYTWSENALLPLGFGHKFLEPVKLPDISVAMPTYQFHPHNAVLWMWTIGGPLGFTGMFAPLVVCVFLAARIYNRAPHHLDKVAALACICMVISHVNQCFGDMGTRTDFNAIGGAVAIALMSKIAVRVGAWPAPVAKVVEDPT